MYIISEYFSTLNWYLGITSCVLYYRLVDIFCTTIVIYIFLTLNNSQQDDNYKEEECNVKKNSVYFICISICWLYLITLKKNKIKINNLWLDAMNRQYTKDLGKYMLLTNLIFQTTSHVLIYRPWHIHVHKR